jgi:hypothetical protein
VPFTLDVDATETFDNIKALITLRFPSLDPKEFHIKYGTTTLHKSQRLNDLYSPLGPVPGTLTFIIIQEGVGCCTVS